MYVYYKIKTYHVPANGLVLSIHVPPKALSDSVCNMVADVKLTLQWSGGTAACACVALQTTGSQGV